jgi:hypothetical protein
LNDDEFKRKYRVTHQTLDKIATAIEDSDVFAEGDRSPKQIPNPHKTSINGVTAVLWEGI